MRNYSLNVGPESKDKRAGQWKFWKGLLLMRVFEPVFDWSAHSIRKLINLSVFWSVAAYTYRQSDISNHAFVSPTITSIQVIHKAQDPRHAKTTRLYMFKQQCYYYYYEHVCVWCLRLLFVSQMWLSIHCSSLKNVFHFALHILRCCLIFFFFILHSFQFCFEFFRRSCVCFYVGMH